MIIIIATIVYVQYYNYVSDSVGSRAFTRERVPSTWHEVEHIARHTSEMIKMRKIMKELKLEQVRKDRFKIFVTHQNIKLKKFVENELRLEFERSRAFCEIKFYDLQK